MQKTVPFEDCPIGMFLSAGGELCLKTKYGLEAYIVSSGERFWGGAKSIKQLRLVQVRPVEVEPVRQGQNVSPAHYSDEFTCSACGFACEITELRYDDDGCFGMGAASAYEYDCKYCPNCGAKMDGGA